MKKSFFILLTLILFHSQTKAFEDYIIVSENPVKTVFSDDENVAVAVPFFNIDNTKETILLKAKGIGNTIITIETTEGEAYINVNVTEDKTFMDKLDYLEYFSLDIPEKVKTEVDLPILRGKH